MEPIQIDLVVAAASAVPVVAGAATVATPKEISRIASRSLRVTLWISYTTQALAIIVFVTGVVLGATGAGHPSESISALLSGGTLAVVSQLVERRTRRAERFALTAAGGETEATGRERNRQLMAELVESIKDPNRRDEVKADIALGLAKDLSHGAIYPNRSPAMDL